MPRQLSFCIPNQEPEINELPYNIRPASTMQICEPQLLSLSNLDLEATYRLSEHHYNPTDHKEDPSLPL